MPESRTPILIGAGQFTQKGVAPEKAQPPVGIAAEAAKAALADTGNSQEVARHIDVLAMVRIFPDSSPRRSHDFGRAANPPRSVAKRIGADPDHAIYTTVGGNVPQKLVNLWCERIRDGEADVVMLCGAEAIATQKAAQRSGISLDWNEDVPGQMEDEGFGPQLVTAHEFAHGIGIPVQTYPLFENAIRGKRGASIQDHMANMGKLFAPFTKVAAANPYAFYPTVRSAEELFTVTPENRYIGFPYPKFVNAQDGVNQGASLILTSVEKARELGIDPAKWIFLHGCSDANEKLLMQDRPTYDASPAIKLCGEKAFAMADKTIDDMNFIDFYSCFTSAVEVAAEALGVAEDDPRGLTVTGGLPFFGGPGNSYSMNAIAEMMHLLRGKPGTFGLVTANGGFLSKHAAGIYSTTPVEGRWERQAPGSYQHIVDDMETPPFTETPEGNASVETYTVVYGRNGPARGIIVGRLEDGTRFFANTPEDPKLLASMAEVDWLGRKGKVSLQDTGINLFTPLS